MPDRELSMVLDSASANDTTVSRGVKIVRDPDASELAGNPRKPPSAAAIALARECLP